MSEAVVMRLWGRLGNQLFIFAAGHAIARRNNARLLFYDWSNTGAASYQLAEVLGPAFRLASPRELLRLGQYAYDTPLRGTLSGWASRLADRRGARASAPRVIWEDRIGPYTQVHSEVLECTPPVLLMGLFQNEAYFADCAAEINDAITLPAGWDDAIKDLPRPIMSVMFRRGDYIDWGWNLPLAYYHNALTYASVHVQPKSLLLFSEDPEFLELAAPWLRGYGEVRLASDITRDPAAQLALVTHCDHHVVANSSYSWWGAWLGEQRSANPCTVIAPEGWLSHDGGTIPSRWVTMPKTTDEPLPWAMDTAEGAQ